MILHRFNNTFLPLLLAAMLTPAVAHAVDIKLPELSDSASSTISLQKEHTLGRTWLKAFRSQTKEFADPETQQYIEQLIYKLTVHSELKDRRLEIVTVDNPTMNAFAVPGGVVGVHTGLFIYAENEHQMASVLAHELAHLSQRHFARRVAEQKKSSITTMAGLLAGLVLAATTDGEAGMAALTASQAIARDQQLRYSRQNEQEADRIGIETLHKAGMDPAAAPAMFERMLQATRYAGHRVPEFLRTHPLTENRIADTQLRLNRYPKKEYRDNLEYHLIKARVQLHQEGNAAKSIKRFRSLLKAEDAATQQAARYGLTLGLIESNQPKEARKHLDLLQKQSSHLLYKLAEIDLLQAEKNYELAEQLARKQLRYHPNSYALQMAQAENYTKALKYDNAEKMLTALSRQRPSDPQVWYQLAEVRGLAGDIAGLHRARAEYFILVGAFTMAREQLTYAAKLTRHDFQQSSAIQEKLIELAELEKQIEKL